MPDEWSHRHLVELAPWPCRPVSRPPRRARAEQHDLGSSDWPRSGCRAPRLRHESRGGVDGARRADGHGQLGAAERGLDRVHRTGSRRTGRLRGAFPAAPHRGQRSDGLRRQGFRVPSRRPATPARIRSVRVRGCHSGVAASRLYGDEDVIGAGRWAFPTPPPQMRVDRHELQGGRATVHCEARPYR